MKTKLLELGKLELELNPKDREVLMTIRALTFMKTDQIMRLFFAESHPNETAATNATRRTLNRLMRLGLVSHLRSQPSGLYYGGKSYIWYLTESGHSLLNMSLMVESKKKYEEPSKYFLRHTIAVAECYVQLHTIVREDEELGLEKILVEPACWRSYEKNGKGVSVRPDLYVVTKSGKYRDSWFIEMDLATETSEVILTKCQRYFDYYLTRKEQERYGIFPTVLYIVPDIKRKEKLIEIISDYSRLGKKRYSLVILPDELASLIKTGAKKEDLC